MNYCIYIYVVQALGKLKLLIGTLSLVAQQYSNCTVCSPPPSPLKLALGYSGKLLIDINALLLTAP